MVIIEDEEGNSSEFHTFCDDSVLFAHDQCHGWGNIEFQLYEDVIKEIESEIRDHVRKLYIEWLIEKTELLVTLNGRIEEKEEIKKYIEDHDNLYWANNDWFQAEGKNYTRCEYGDISDHYCCCHPCGETEGHLILARANVYFDKDEIE